MKKIDMSAIYREDASEEELALAVQSIINSGAVWSMNGSEGRRAMGMIEAGLCMVGTEPRSDYWGNRIPSREMLKAGTKGTFDFVVAARGKAWAKKMAAVS